MIQQREINMGRKGDRRRSECEEFGDAVAVTVTVRSRVTVNAPVGAEVIRFVVAAAVYPASLQ
jgi:hypothetical protein